LGTSSVFSVYPVDVQVPVPDSAPPDFVDSVFRRIPQDKWIHHPDQWAGFSAQAGLAPVLVYCNWAVRSEGAGRKSLVFVARMVRPVDGHAITQIDAENAAQDWKSWLDKTLAPTPNTAN
jgi:hypothetical protein